MKNHFRIIVALALSVSLAGTAFAEEKALGAAEFKRSCAACHGPAGRGDGPLVDFLKVKPKSLTLIAKEHAGVFPFQKVHDIIAGTKGVRAHGTEEMPVWGDVYMAEAFAEDDPFGTAYRAAVEARILKIVIFLASIQE